MEIRHLKALIKDKMHHDYIEQYVKTPSPDESKLCVMSSILKQSAVSEERKQHYIVTAMLIQIALDTHDQVTDTDESVSCDKSEKTKQLSVLAGDYYSGLYYLILSEAEETGMTRALATSITEINELKMQLYHETFHSLEAFIDVIKTLESRLIMRMAEFVGETALSSIAAEWLIIKKLMTIKHHIMSSGLDTAFDPWSSSNPVTDYQTVLDTIDLVISKENSVIDKQLAQFPAHLTSAVSLIRNRLHLSTNSQVQ
ncbi:heptaprenyl diphosphate synthase component 1 [Lentibacillus kimchii]